jgi:glycerol-1-phosphate dehydrogenase [NAD(P)+]
MDGYASSGAAMITDGMKVTYSAGVPIAILADTKVIKNAPIDMIKAGYGDIIGKYSALNDWKLGAVVNGEYFCDYVYTLTANMVKKVLPLAKKLLERDEEGVGTLMEALILVGIAMSFAGNSRPASGSEHHLSHYFEITGIVDSKPYLPHGIDVVFSTVITSRLREIIAETDFPASDFRQSNEERSNEIRRVYKSVADGCLALQDKLGTYRDLRAERYRANEKTIKKILKEAPSSEEIEKILENIELDINDFYATYSEEKIVDAIRYAKDLKDRYTILWMYYDMFGID